MCQLVTGFRPFLGQVQAFFWMRKLLESDLFESHQLPALLKAGAMGSSALKGGLGLQIPASTTPFVFSVN